MRVFGTLAAWASLAAVAWAGDWASWRGPEMNGVSREKNLVEDWSLDGNKNVLWTSEIGGRSTPIVMNGRVYLDCRTEHDVNDRTSDKGLVNAGEQVVCWDAKTGEELWRDKFNVFLTDIPGPRVGWASLVGDQETGNVYLHSVSGILRCYTADGKVVWERSLFEEFGKLSGYGARTTTPLIDEDRLIVGIPVIGWGEAGPPPKHWFYAFDKRTGKLLWAAAPGGAIQDTFYTNPIVAVIGGVRQLISGNGDGGVYGINARTGEKLWGMMLTRRGMNASPVVDGNYVYITHGEDNVDTTEFGRVQCIDATQRGDLSPRGKKAEGEVAGSKPAAAPAGRPGASAPSAEVGGGVEPSPAAAAQAEEEYVYSKGVWRVDGIRAGYASPCVHDGILYVVTDSGQLVAFDAKDGTRLWEYKIGTVGKGSPVWADGKIYVMEVNGRIHILKAGREKAEKLSEVVLPAGGNQRGTDEIYASPAIADGRIYFVTRDRVICVGTKDAQPSSDPVPPRPEEKPAGDEIASLQLVPYEIAVSAGEKVEYEVRAYDANGRFLRTIDEFKLTPDAGLAGATADGKVLTTAASPKLPQAGVVTVEAEGKAAKARLRSYPPLPWKWDMEGLTGKAVPAGWLNAGGKLAPVEKDGSTVLKSSAGAGKSGFHVPVGPPSLSNYVVQADAMLEGKRSLFSVGLVANRYEFVCKANTLKLAIHTWPAHLRVNKEIKFTADPGVWYTMKMGVTVEEGKALVRGKIWKRGEAEPAEWTLEQTDPNPNDHGSPGLFTYRITAQDAFAYYDNVIVAPAEGSAVAAGGAARGEAR